MAELLVSSRDEAMRALLTLIGQDHQQTVTPYADPLEVLQVLETSTVPMIALFDVWLDRWDDEAQLRLARYSGIPTRHVTIVLWDAHIALPPTVRAAFAAQRVPDRQETPRTHAVRRRPRGRHSPGKRQTG